MNDRLASRVTQNDRMFRLISYLLVFLMMTCGAMVVGSFIQNVAQSWHSPLIAGILLFVVADRFYIHQRLKSLTPLSSEWLITLGSQWIVILLFLRLLLSYANGLVAFQRELSRIARGFLIELFTVEFVFSILLAVLVWYISGHFLNLLDEIGLDQELALQEEPPIVQREAVPARQRLVSLIFSLGIVLVVLTALARINLRTILSNESGLPNIEVSRFSGGEAGALLYFVFGLALLSLGRLLSLQTQWKRQHIPISSGNLVRQWSLYSLIFLMILAVVVSLLPSGESLGLISILGSLFGFLGSIFFFIGQMVLFLVSLLISLPMFLFLRGDSTPEEPLPSIPPLPTMPVEPAVPPAPSELWILVRSILLWSSLAVIVFFALVQFVRQHGGIRAALRKSRLTNWLALAWQWLYRNAGKTRESLSQVIADGWQGIVSRLAKGQIVSLPGMIRLRSLDPRRQIYFFYLAMIRRGEEQGVPRKPSQSASEYAVQLEKALPSAGEDIDSITKAFVEARYSRQDIDSKKANVVKETWGRIRRALRDKSKSETSRNQ
jgi:hypothetical protein